MLPTSTASRQLIAPLGRALTRIVGRQHIVLWYGADGRPERLELLDRAEELARQMFEYPTEAHVEGVLDRLLWNEFHGLGEAGASTLH